MCMREQNQIYRRQIRNLQPGTLDSFQEKKPVGKVGIDQNIQIVELNQERGVANPGQRHMTARQLGKLRASLLSRAFGEEGLPHHLVKKSAGIEMVTRGEFLERTWQSTRACRLGLLLGMLTHAMASIDTAPLNKTQ